MSSIQIFINCNPYGDKLNNINKNISNDCSSYENSTSDSINENLLPYDDECEEFDNFVYECYSNGCEICYWKTQDCSKNLFKTAPCKIVKRKLKRKIKKNAKGSITEKGIGKGKLKSQGDGKSKLPAGQKLQFGDADTDNSERNTKDTDKSLLKSQSNAPEGVGVEADSKVIEAVSEESTKPLLEAPVDSQTIPKPTDTVTQSTAPSPQGTSPAPSPQGVSPASSPTGASPASSPTGASPASSPTGASPAPSPKGASPTALNVPSAKSPAPLSTAPSMASTAKKTSTQPGYSANVDLSTEKEVRKIVSERQNKDDTISTRLHWLKEKRLKSHKSEGSSKNNHVNRLHWIT